MYDIHTGGHVLLITPSIARLLPSHTLGLVW